MPGPQHDPSAPTGGDGSTGPGTNWAGNHTYTAGRYVRAGSLEEAQEVIRASSKVRLLGTRHSFNALCDTEGTLLDLTGLAAEPVLDLERGMVRVAGGTPYNDVAAHLQSHGWALANMGSLPHISVAGATSTGTHGSGATNRILGAGVSRLELIGPDGELRTISRGEPDFDGSVVALGAVGAVVSLDLDVEPTYDVRQDLYAHLRWSEVVERIDEVLGSAYSVSVFGRWNDEDPTEVLAKTRLTDDRGPADWTGGIEAVPADTASLTLGAGDHITVRGTPGPWSERLPHFRGDRQPSFGAEIQSEWFVPAESAVGALRAVTDLAATTSGELADLLIVTEIRAIRADDLWLSPAQGRETVALHFTWKREPEAVLAMVRRVEDALDPYAARPHWGKVYDRLDPANHPRLADFRALVERVDPSGTFRNPMVERVLGLG
ncbi:FAD-binding protein [Nocardioides sp. zg-1308]|uniref:D-arabinono-1,4-lactone oxidase n=1 Tax=Nocardioides sp. zg-1308 TaxID=2736253 RepID=UPI0015545097|nr:D-arabinono-1,4-lactone oxidase [Nocardioides sp. zg-1308]NPD04868.1 FAD-binding protein [Nocardioides sp. zg-1308]